MKKTILLLCTILFTGLLTGQNLVILHTNDTHSQIEAFDQGRNAGTAGILSRSAYIQQVREENPCVLYLDGGDYNQGSPYFNLFHGDIEVEMMNRMGLDATVLGNHEFDNGFDDLVRRLKKAKYSTLCANMDIQHKALNRIVKPYVILKKGGLKIGVIGLCVPLKGLSSYDVYSKMRFLNPAQVSTTLAKKLRKKGCDLVICLSHMGLDGDKKTAAKTSGVDFFIGGHSHSFMTEPAIVHDLDGKEVPIVQAGAYGVYVGRLDIDFSGR